MTTRDFCYWLQGYYELNGTKKYDTTADENFHKMIQDHLKLVFKHDVGVQANLARQIEPEDFNRKTLEQPKIASSFQRGTPPYTEGALC